MRLLVRLLLVAPGVGETPDDGLVLGHGIRHGREHVVHRELRGSERADHDLALGIVRPAPKARGLRLARDREQLGSVTEIDPARLALAGAEPTDQVDRPDLAVGRTADQVGDPSAAHLGAADADDQEGERLRAIRHQPLDRLGTLRDELEDDLANDPVGPRHLAVTVILVAELLLEHVGLAQQLLRKVEGPRSVEPVGPAFERAGVVPRGRRCDSPMG